MRPIDEEEEAAITRLSVQEAQITNPWTKKNPFLSMFLSGALAAAGPARSVSLQQARRGQATAVKQATKSWIDLWTPKPSHKRRKSNWDSSRNAPAGNRSDRWIESGRCGQVALPGSGPWLANAGSKASRRPGDRQAHADEAVHIGNARQPRRSHYRKKLDRPKFQQLEAAPDCQTAQRLNCWSLGICAPGGT